MTSSRDINSPEAALERLSVLYSSLGGQQRKAVHAGVVWEVLAEVDKRVGEEALVIFPKARQLQREFLRVKEYVNNHSEFFPKIDASAPLLTDRETSVVEDSRIDIEHATLAVLRQKAPSRPQDEYKLLQLLKPFVGVAFSSGIGRSIQQKRDQAKEELVATGFSRASCDALTASMPLLSSFLSQLFCSFDGSTKTPPVQLQKMYQKSGDRWVLNEAGKLALKFFGVEKSPSEHPVVDRKDMKNFCATVEANIFRIFINFRRHSQKGRIDIPKECEKELASLTRAAMSGKPVSPERLQKLGEKLSEHFLRILFPKGSDDIAAIPGLDVAIYQLLKSQVEKALGHSLQKLDIELRNPTVRGKKEGLESEEVALENIYGPLFDVKSAESLSKLIGEAFLEILPIPGFSEMSQMLSQNLAEASPGTVSQFFEKAAQSVMSDLMKADDVTDVKKGTVARLDRLGFSRGSLEAFSSISSKLPSFIIDTLRVYKNNPQCEPPGFLRSFFVQKEHSWALNDTGNLLLVLFEKERGGISAFFEANALELVRNICAQLRDPTFSLPPELLSGGDPTARAQAITAFILERANIESLTFPVVLRPFQPLLLTLVKPLLEKKIETDLLPFLEVLPQTAVRKLAEPKKTAPPPPLMPPELYATYADFGRILGPALLENIPELSMLSDACKLHPQSDGTDTLLSFSADFTRIIGEGLVKAQDFDTEIQIARERLKTLGFDETSVTTLGSTINGLLEYVPAILEIYDGKKAEPLGRFQQFFHPIDSDGVYHLNETGHFLISILKSGDLSKGIAAMVEANALTILETFCRKIKDGSIHIPKEILETGDLSTRTEALTTFVLTSCFGSSNLHLALPRALRPIEPLLMDILKPTIQADFQNGLMAFDSEFKRLQAIASGTLVTTSVEKKQPSIIPEQIVDACQKFQPLGHLLGPMALSMPEFAPVQESMKTALPDPTLAPLSQFAGQIGRVVMGGLIQDPQLSVRVNKMRDELIRFGLTDTDDKPGELIKCSMKYIQEALQNPKKPHSPTLNGFYLQDSPEELNDLGRLLVTMLSDENRANFEGLLEANMLQILLHTVEHIDREQNKDPNYLLNLLGSELQKITDSITTQVEDGRPFSEGALSITDRLLRVALPDNNGLVFPPALQALGPELSKILIAGLHATIRKSADHVQKNFSSIISELLSKTLLGQSVGKGSFLKTFFSSLRTAVKETPKKNHAEKEALKKTIEDLTVAILPGLSRFRRIIGFLASRFFGIGQLRIGTIVNAALESLPEPEIMLTEIFPEPTATMPSPKDAAVQADTPVELIRKKLNIMKESVRAQLNKIDALKHPRQAISVALKLFGVSILALIAPKIMSKAMGASAHENTITLIEKLIKGVLGPASTAPLSQHL